MQDGYASAAGVRDFVVNQSIFKIFSHSNIFLSDDQACPSSQGRRHVHHLVLFPAIRVCLCLRACAWTVRRQDFPPATFFPVQDDDPTAALPRLDNDFGTPPSHMTVWSARLDPVRTQSS